MSLFEESRERSQAGLSHTNTMKREDIIKAVRAAVPVSKGEAEELVCKILKHMCQTLCQGENISIWGFGLFHTYAKAERRARNPKTGEEALVTARRVLKFCASAKMRRLLTEGRMAETQMGGRQGK